MKVQDRIDLFVKKFGFMPEAYEICPKWDYCSCNKCPLHKDYSNLKISPEDKTKKCKCPKQIRKQIGIYFKLKSMGLTLKELDSMKKSIRMKKEVLSIQGNNLKTPTDNNINELLGGKEGKMNIINKTINQLVHEVREVHTNPMNFTIKQYGKN